MKGIFAMIQLSNDALWNEVRERLAAAPEHLAELRRLADLRLHGPLYAVTDKTVPTPSGDPHDYASFAKYNWPDPANPGRWINRDGERNPLADEYDSPRQLQFFLAVTTLTGAARLTGEAAYGEKAGLLLRRWYLEPETRMNPHLRHAQLCPGERDGAPWGIIDTHFLTEVLEAVRSLEFNREWRPEHLAGLQNWCREYLAWLLEDAAARLERKNTNNHGTWYDAQVVTLMLFTGDEEGARRHLLEVSLPRLDGQLSPDGSLPEETRRTLGLFYSYFNLFGWSWLAAYGKRLGVDVWNHSNRNGDTLKKACDWMLPHFFREKRWPYQQIHARPRDIEYCRLFALVEPVDDNPRIAEWMRETKVNPIWRLPAFMTDDDWQQLPQEEIDRE